MMKIQHIINRRMTSLASACLTLLTATALFAGNPGYANEDTSKYIHHISRFIADGTGSSADESIEQTISRLQNGAKQRNAECMNTLGVCYLNGIGLAKDYARAVYWFRKSAEQGYRMAMCNLGMCYLNGTGVEQDSRQAVALFTVAGADPDSINSYEDAYSYLLKQIKERNKKDAEK